MADEHQVAEHSQGGTPADPLPYAKPEVVRSNPLAHATLVFVWMPLVAIVLLILRLPPAPLIILLVVSPVLALVLAIMARRQEAEAKGTGYERAKTALMFAGFEVGLLLLVAMLIPQMGRAKERAQRVKCASNLRQIGQGILLYANEHQSQYPPTLDLLIAHADVDAGVFVCPSADSSVARGPTTQAVIDAFNANLGHCDYVYVGASLHGGDSADHIIAYEKHYHRKRDGAAHEGMNFLFNDGHVDFIPRPEADRIVAELQAGHNPPRPDRP